MLALTPILNNGGTTGLNPLGEHFVVTLSPGEPDSPIAIVNTSTGSKVGYVNPLSHQVTSFGGLLHVRIRQMAVSADGQTIAHTARRCTAAPGLARTSLVVVNLATGEQRQWAEGNRQAFFDSMSLTADGTTLVFTADQLNGVSSAVYLLDTSAAPGPVAQRSRILVKPADPRTRSRSATP